MSELLVANTSAVIRFGGTRRVITRNKTIVRSDDELVKGREGLFRPVESATAAPGEVRATSRRGRKKAMAADVEAEATVEATAETSENDAEKTSSEE